MHNRFSCLVAGLAALLPMVAPGVEPAAAESAAPVAAVAPGLDSNLLYHLLAAEVAMQRNQPLGSFDFYLEAARQARDPAIAELAVRAAITAQAQDQARQALDLWLGLTPDSLKAHQVAAYVALEGNDRAAALEHLRRVVALSATTQQGYLNSARLLARLADPSQRLALMVELVGGEARADADALLALATLAAGASDSARARDYARRAAEARPAWNRPRQFLAQMLIGDGRQHEARTMLERYFAAGYEDPELRMLYAQLLIASQEYSAARATFDTLLQSRPDFPNALFAAAVLSLQLEDAAAARDYLMRLRESGQRAEDTDFLLGQTEELAGNAEAALDWYAKVRGNKATDAQVRTAAIYIGQGQVERARELFRRLREQAPADSVNLYLIEAEVLREEGRDTLALETYARALERDPDNADLLYARALLAARLHRVDMLERDLRRVLTMNPDHADALNALGYTLADQTDRLDEARAFIERALQLQPKEPAILDSMGWLLYRMGRTAAAEPYLREALELMFDGEIAAHLGEVLWALGRRDEARAIWAKALKDDPEHEYLLEVLARHAIPHAELMP